MTTTARDVAREMHNRQLLDELERTFPGIQDVRLRTVSHASPDSDDLANTELIGQWHDLYVGIFAGGPTGYNLCDCCARYAVDVTWQPQELAGLKTDPNATIPECRDCQWLHPAQDAAQKATTRWRRWRFTRTYLTDIEWVRAQHHRPVTHQR